MQQINDFYINLSYFHDFFITELSGPKQCQSEVFLIFEGADQKKIGKNREGEKRGKFCARRAGPLECTAPKRKGRDWGSRITEYSSTDCKTAPLHDPKLPKEYLVIHYDPRPPIFTTSRFCVLLCATARRKTST